MKPSKMQRQSRILKLIRENPIETQSDLVAALLETGMSVTQATVSRDIKELGITKVSTGDGISKYVSMKHSGEVAAGRLLKVFTEAVMSITTTQCFIIIRTLPGLAQAAASALDSMHLDHILGTVGGDDTIFVATRSEDFAEGLKNKLIDITAIDRDTADEL